MTTWALILFFHVGLAGSGDSNAATSVQGFQTERLCEIAGRKASGMTNLTVKKTDYERLQAERDVLLNLLERSSEWVYPPDEGCRCDTCREALALSDAIDAAMEGDKP